MYRHSHAVFAVDAPTWDYWDDIPDYSDVDTDDRVRADPYHQWDDKDWWGWNVYTGIVCGELADGEWWAYG